MIAVVGILIGFNALYVAGEFSTVSARKTRIIQMADEGNRLAKLLLPIIQDHHKLDNYIAASQVGITVSSVVLGIYGQQQIAPRITPLIARLPLSSGASSGGELAAAGISATLVLIVLTTLQVVMGELLPKSIGVQYPERLALLTALPMRWSADIFLKPLIVLLNGSGALVLRLLGIRYDEGHTHVHSPDEIMILAQESHEGGLIDDDEHRLIHRLFRISDRRAGEIAIPRNRVVAAPVDSSIEEVLQLSAGSSFSRILIFEDDIDHIIGFVHLRDLFDRYRKDKQASLRSILRPLPFLPETLPSMEVWNRLDETQSYLAVVIDEFGGTAGLITREDLIEELFGEVQDEFDQERELITPVGEAQLVVRGDALIADLNDLLNIDLPHETSHTIGGLVLDRLGRIPVVGDEVEIEGIHVRVESIDDMAVGAIRLTLPPGTSIPPLEEMI